MDELPVITSVVRNGRDYLLLLVLSETDGTAYCY